MSEHLADQTADGVRTLTLSTDAPVSLQFTGRSVDLDVDLSAEPGTGSIEFTGPAGADLDAIEAGLRDGRLTVRVPPLADVQGFPGISITIGRRMFSLGRTPRLSATATLPPGVSLDLDAGDGDVSVSGSAGAIRVKTSSGDVHVDSAATVRVETASGDVSVDRCEGGTLTSGSGDLNVAEATGAIDLRSGSGYITVSSLSGELRGASGSGDISVEEVLRGSVDCHTGSGDIAVAVRAGLAVWQDLSSGSGDVDRTLSARGEPAPGAPFVSVKAATTSGDVALADA